MRRLSRGIAGVGTVLVVLSLAAAGAALAARAGGYTGKTSQGQSVSFNLSNGSVRNFKIVVHDRARTGTR